MTEKRKVVIKRATKEELFNLLKAEIPTFIGSYNWVDVDDIEPDPSDSSNIQIRMKEEDE
jgi:hypothetical protein